MNFAVYQSFPTSRTLFLHLNGLHYTFSAKDVTTNCGRLFLHSVHADSASKLKFSRYLRRGQATLSFRKAQAEVLNHHHPIPEYVKGEDMHLSSLAKHSTE
eukprot:c10023_g1_i1 orf=235-537(-)